MSYPQDIGDAIARAVAWFHADDESTCVHCLDPIGAHDNVAGCERCGCTHVVFEPEPVEEGR